MQEFEAVKNLIAQYEEDVVYIKLIQFIEKDQDMRERVIKSVVRGIKLTLDNSSYHVVAPNVRTHVDRCANDRGTTVIYLVIDKTMFRDLYNNSRASLLEHMVMLSFGLIGLRAKTQKID